MTSEVRSWFQVVATPPSLARDITRHRTYGFIPGVTALSYPIARIVGEDTDENGRPVEGIELAVRYAYGGPLTSEQAAAVLHESWRLGIHSQDPSYLFVFPPGPNLDMDTARAYGGYLYRIGRLCPRGVGWPFILALGHRMIPPVGFPEGALEDLLFMAYALAPVIVGDVWQDRPAWAAWAAHRTAKTERLTFDAMFGPDALFIPEERLHADVVTMTDVTGDTHVILRTMHRQFFSTRPVRLGLEPGTRREAWNGTWDHPGLQEACTHPFLMTAAELPSSVSAVALGPEVTDAHRSEMAWITGVFEPLRDALPRISAMTQSNLPIETVVQRVQGEFPALKLVSEERVKWLLVGIVNICQDSARLWPLWFADVAAATNTAPMGTVAEA